MWLSKKAGRAGREPEESARSGCVTIGGENTAVYTAGEYRNLETLTCGAMFWRPKLGQNVVVLKTAEGDRMITGLIQDMAPAEMGDGEIYIVTENASVEIKNDGRIRLVGDVEVEGTLRINGGLCKRC